jgi:HEPN domain-containing protein
VPRPGKTVVAARAEASLFRAKAEQFLEECRTAADAGRYDATMLTAVRAVIAATDAVTVALAGRRSADPNHQRAADLLEQVAQDSPELKARVRQVRELLARKNVVEYESRRASAREARDALKRAERFAAWARETVARARG